MQESYHYKNDLLNFASDLKRRLKRQIWRQDSLNKAEKIIFTGFYYVRKLIESIKVTDGCKKSSHVLYVLSVQSDTPTTNWDRWDILDHIRYEEMVKKKMDVSQICDKVIHAWWNMFCQSENGGLEAIMITTDRMREREVWWLPASTIIEVFNQFGNNWPTKITAKRNECGQLVYWKNE